LADKVGGRRWWAKQPRRLTMPRILVMADEGDGRETVVLLHERVIPSELESDRLSARLIERVGWALVDADEIEQRAPSPGEHPVRMTVMQHEGATTAPQTQPLRAA
jgi:hypothetical protein